MVIEFFGHIPKLEYLDAAGYELPSVHGRQKLAGCRFNEATLAPDDLPDTVIVFDPLGKVLPVAYCPGLGS